MRTQPAPSLRSAQLFSVAIAAVSAAISAISPPPTSPTPPRATPTAPDPAAITVASGARPRRPRLTRTGLLPTDPKSLADFADLLKLRSLSDSTQKEYLRNLRRLAAQTKRDPATLAEADLRAYIIKLKDESRYASSTLRTAVAAFHVFYNTHLGHAWTLFSLVRCPDDKTLPQVLTTVQVQRLLASIRLPRFRVLFGLLYACGLRLSEALSLEIRDIRDNGRHLHLRAEETKGRKARVVPLPSGTVAELRAYWKTHRHPRFILFHRRPLAGTRSVTPPLRCGATP